VHLLGTCRMGNDPGTSVIDKYHRCHDVPNLFICDGSSLVTSGRGQPTMIIQARVPRGRAHGGLREPWRDLSRSGSGLSTVERCADSSLHCAKRRLPQSTGQDQHGDADIRSSERRRSYFQETKRFP
jgi:hypothetical protein